MKKFLAVVKHEYRKIVLKWSFLIATLLVPVLGGVFAVVPALLFSIKSEPTRLVVVDQTGRIAPRIKENLSLEKTTEKEKQKSVEELINDSATAKPDEQMNRIRRRRQIARTNQARADRKNYCQRTRFLFNRSARLRCARREI